MSVPQTPIVTTSAVDEVEGALTAPPDSSINFVDDKDTLEWVLTNIVPLLPTVRADGVAQRSEWAQIRRMTMLQKDDTSAYVGQSNAYLPVYQKARETRVSHIAQGLFPSDTYIDAEAEDPAMQAMSSVNKAWMMYQLEQAMKLRAELKPFIRSLTDYGIGIAKIWWEKPPKSVKGTKLTRLPGIAEVLHDYGAQPWNCEGARFRTRSPFSWYLWPVSASAIEEASIVFEDIQVSKQFVDQMARAGIWKDPEFINSTINQDALQPEVRTALMETRGSAQHSTDLRQGELATWTLLTECWLSMPVPSRLYRQNETPGTPVPVKVVLAGGIPIEVRRNPFWHQRPPYLLHRMNEATDSFYSVGMGRSMLSLQGLINDFMNQTNDNGIYGLNPIIKYNPNLVVGPLEPLAPGRMIPLTDPEGMVFDRPPVEQLQYGLALVNQMITYANDLSGVPAVLQGSGAKGGAKTATGSQILQNNVKGELQDLIEDLELRVLMPMMHMVHSLGQQYESAERYLAIAGGEKVQFSRDMLQGEFNWRWVASSQAMNRQMRAQQTGQFLQMATSPAVLQLLMQRGRTVDPEAILRKLWEDGLGLRNFDKLLTAMPMMPGMPPGGGGGPPPGAGASPQDPRSAVEQAEGGSGEMAAGEGEAFGEVREGADEMAAQQGAMFGGG